MKYRLLRLPRLLQWVNEDSTLDNLEHDIVAGFPNTTKRQNATNEVIVGNIEFTPYNNGILHVEAATRSNGHNYETEIQFQQVQQKETDDGTTITIQGTDGQQHHIVPIQTGQSNVKVRCSCLDFHYRFAAWNDQDNSLYGEPPGLYRKKTDRASVNPTRTSGICKHIIKLTQRLQQLGVVR